LFYNTRNIFKALTARERLIFWGALASTLLSGFFLALFFFNQVTIAVPLQGGTYHEGVVGQPIFINPVVSSNDADRDISRLIFSDVQQVAEQVKSDEDGLVWTVRLHDNLFWSDGERLTSDDIIFTIRTIQDPDSFSPLASSWQGVRVERESELELRFILRLPYAFFDDNLQGLFIIPRHIFGNIPSANFRLSIYGLEPVGSGPYRYESFKKQKDGFITEYRLVTNDYYAGERPFIDSVVFKFYQDEDDLLQAYNDGLIDGFGTSNAQLVSKLRLRHQLFEMQVPRYYAIFLNQSVAEQFKDPKIRHALSGVLDRDQLVSDIFDNYALPSYGPLPFSESLDVEFQSDVLSGLQFELIVPEVDFLIRTAYALQQKWESYGAIVNVVALPQNQIQTDVIKTRNYGALLFGNILGKNYDLFSFWHSSERFYPGLNLALYNNKSVDGLIETVRKDFDPASRLIELEELDSLIRHDTPALFLFSPYYLYVATPTLRGFEAQQLTTPPMDRFLGISNWYLKTAYIFQ